MPKKFNERFSIEISVDEARMRFVNRAHNDIYQTLAYHEVHESYHYRIALSVASHLGDRYENPYLINFVGKDFQRNLRALEGLYAAFGEIGYSPHQGRLSAAIERLLVNAEVDLGIRWDKGLFYPSGAALLDERLVNDSLHWLRERKYESVVKPLEKGLRHLLDARKRPELAEDVVTDAYEALEALAAIVTERKKDLSANQELFIAAVKASDGYKKLLKEYIAYANTFRHAKEQNKPRPKVSLEEAESFVYLTGIFIRFAVLANN